MKSLRAALPVVAVGTAGAIGTILVKHTQAGRAAFGAALMQVSFLLFKSGRKQRGTRLMDLSAAVLAELERQKLYGQALLILCSMHDQQGNYRGALTYGSIAYDVIEKSNLVEDDPEIMFEDMLILLDLYQRRGGPDYAPMIEEVAWHIRHLMMLNLSGDGYFLSMKQELDGYHVIDRLNSSRVT